MEKLVQIDVKDVKTMNSAFSSQENPPNIFFYGFEDNFPQSDEPFPLKMPLCKNSQGQIVNNVPSPNKNISAGSNLECMYTVTPSLQNICYGRPDPEDCISKTVLLFKNLDWIIQRKSIVSGHPV